MTDSEIIKAIREDLGLSQKEMAEKLEVSQSAISSIEVGRNPIYHDLFKRLVLKLNVNPWYFIKDGQPRFLAGKTEIDAMKKKIREYEKLILKLVDIKNSG